MAVEVEYKKRTGKWAVIKTSSGGSSFGYTHEPTSTHDTRSAAVSKARRVAAEGEKITLLNTEGRREIVRQGEFSPGL